MAVVLVSTSSGCRAFTDTGEREMELAGRQVSVLQAATGGTCLAVVDDREIWRRAPSGTWSQVATATISLQSLTSVEETIFAGGKNEAAVIRVPPGGNPERLSGFDNVPGRQEWFAGGPPLGVRALTATADGAAILAAVHVGGIPLSLDGGETWKPTIPVMFDVHEVRAHPSLPNVVAAAAAVGLCISHDAGRNWCLLSKGLDGTSLLAVGVLEDEVLFSVQDGPFAKRSQIWRWRIGGEAIEQVRDGLPEWLDGRVDTAQIATGAGRTAVFDGGGNLWLSSVGSNGWQRIATDLPYTFGLVII